MTYDAGGTERLSPNSLIPTDADGGLVERFRRARHDPGLAVLEGFHPLKHGLRFGAELLEIVSEDRERLAWLAHSLAPDIGDMLASRTTQVDADIFRRLAPKPPPTGVVAIARRVDAPPEQILGSPYQAPVVLLDRPARLGNLGAAIRAAAAAEAGGVIALGSHDPWHPEAIRGSAGLHFALPVARGERLPDSDRPLIAVEPGGEPLAPGVIPARAILAFGSERQGLSSALLERADGRVGIPMRAGVSSLNLAASVAVVLYAWRFGSSTSPI